MSIFSENPYKRLFIYQNDFNFEGKPYHEHFYYLIESVEKSGQTINNIVISKIFFVEEYLKQGANVRDSLTIIHPNIPKNILVSANEFLRLKEFGRF